MIKSKLSEADLRAQRSIGNSGSQQTLPAFVADARSGVRLKTEVD
ncbi:hypothetical protein [Litoreibacter sp.]